MSCLIRRSIREDLKAQVSLTGSRARIVTKSMTASALITSLALKATVAKCKPFDIRQKYGRKKPQEAIAKSITEPLSLRHPKRRIGS